MTSHDFFNPNFSTHDHPFLKALSSPYGYPTFSHQALHFAAGSLAAAAKLPIDFITHVRFERLVLSYPNPRALFGPHLRSQALRFGGSFWLIEAARAKLDHECDARGHVADGTGLLGPETPSWATAGMAGAIGGTIAECVENTYNAAKLKKERTAILAEAERERAKKGKAVRKINVSVSYHRSIYVEFVAATAMWSSSFAIYEAMKSSWITRNDGSTAISFWERWRMAAIAGGVGQGTYFLINQLNLRDLEAHINETFSAINRHTVKGKARLKELEKEANGKSYSKDTTKFQERDATGKKRRKKPPNLSWLNKDPAAAADIPYLEPVEPLARLSRRWWRMFFRSTVKGSLIFGSALALQDVIFTGMTEAGAGREEGTFEWSRLMGWRFRD